MSVCSLYLLCPLNSALSHIIADRSLRLRVSRFVASLFVHAFLSFRLDHVYSEVQVRPSAKSLSNYCSLTGVFLLKMLKVPLAYQKTTFSFHLSRGICWGLCFSEAVLLWPGVPCLTLLCCSQRAINGFIWMDCLASFPVGGTVRTLRRKKCLWPYPYISGSTRCEITVRFCVKTSLPPRWCFPTPFF